MLHMFFQIWRSAWNFSKHCEKFFHLILFNIDKIVDDTSLEKLLEVVQSLHGDLDEKKTIENVIVTYFSQIQHVERIAPSTLRFTLRLSVVIASSCDRFLLLSSVDNILEYLLHEIIRKHEFWTDPRVRDSYFKATLGIIRSNNGFIWLQESGSRSSLVSYHQNDMTSFFSQLNIFSFVLKDALTQTLTQTLTQSFTLTQFLTLTQISTLIL